MVQIWGADGALVHWRVILAALAVPLLSGWAGAEEAAVVGAQSNEHE